MKKFSVILPILMLLLTGCVKSGEDSSSSILPQIPIELFDSSEVRAVKNGSVQACPFSTLGEMAEAFMSNPSWSDFTSNTGTAVVELTGQISYSGLPATAVIQFEVFGSTFETSYLGINGIDQNKLVLSALLTKMCDAVI